MLARSSMQGAISPNGNAEAPPQLHGDGATDDTSAVQWYLDHCMKLPPLPEGMSYWVRLSALRFPPGGFGIALSG